MYCILLCTVHACRHVCLWIKYCGNLYFNICSFWIIDRNRIRNYKNNNVKQLQLQQITKQHKARTRAVSHYTSLNRMHLMTCCLLYICVNQTIKVFSIYLDFIRAYSSTLD